MRIKSIIFIVLILAISSCSVKKRNYRKGYHIDWAFSKKNAIQKNNESGIAQHLVKLNPNTVVETEEMETPVAVASTEKINSETVQLKKKVLLLLTDSCGDIMTFKSGDIVKVKVTEITEDKIKYKRCDNLNGPVFVVSKTTVHSIKYLNGVTDVIEPPTHTPYQKNLDPTISQLRGPIRVHPKAVWALVLLILSFVPFLFGIPIIFSLIQANKAIREINANPKIYKGIILAKVIRTLDIIMLGLLALLLVIVIIALLIVSGVI